MDYSHKSIFLWCRDASSRIWYKRDRVAVEHELHQHLEDRYESFINRGYDSEEAATRTIEAMGSAEEVARLLARTYNPFWPILHIASKVMVGIALVLMLATVVSIVKNFDDYRYASPEYCYLQDTLYNPYSESHYKDNSMVAEMLKSYAQESTGSVTRFPMTLTDVAHWRRTIGKTEFDILHIRMEMSHPSLFFTGIDTAIYKDIWAIDSTGRYYFCASESVHGNAIANRIWEPYIVGCCENGGWGKYLMEFAVVDFKAEGVEWIELHYDRDGKDYTMRIYLQEDDAQW